LSGSDEKKKEGIEALAALGRKALEKAKGGQAQGPAPTGSPAPAISKKTAGESSGGRSGRTRPMGSNDMGTFDLGAYLAAYGVKVS
jgi:hypothetical protein